MTQVFPGRGRGKQKLKLEPQWGGRTLGEAWVESEGKRLQVSSADLVVESEGKRLLVSSADLGRKLMILRQKLVWREKQLAVVTRAVVLAGLLVQSFAFGSTAWAPATPRIRQACSSNRPNAMAPIPLRMQLQGPGEGSDELPAGWGKVAINLEGHFKPSVGFVPHALKTDGDFASGDAKFDLKYDHAAGGAKTAVEICGVGPTYEDFIAGFTPQSDPGWSVDPAEGCLDVQGGEADCLQVTYSGACDAPKFGTLVVVIPSISESFTFKFRVQP